MDKRKNILLSREQYDAMVKRDILLTRLIARLSRLAPDLPISDNDPSELELLVMQAVAIIETNNHK